MWILIGADFLPAHIVGLRLLIAGLRARGAVISTIRLAVGVPRSAQATLARAVPLRDVFVHAIDPAPNADRFFAKIQMVRSFVEHFAAASDNILYLDYDHVCLKPLPFRCSDVEVLVGSESILSLPYDSVNGCSSSLILGSANCLRPIVAQWERAYDDLASLGERHREETAFALAAHRTGITLRPAALQFQSSWAGYDRECSLFHYGGETATAVAAKGSLASLALDDDVSCANDLSSEKQFRCRLALLAQRSTLNFLGE